MNRNKKNFYQDYKHAKILHDVYYWVTDCLNINFPDSLISSYSYMAKNENIEELCNMIAAFGTGIVHFQMVDISAEQVVSHLPKKGRDELIQILNNDVDRMKADAESELKGISHIIRTRKELFIITKNNILFELSEESDGTVRILDLLEILLADAGKTYVIDELDRCLHPGLTYKFVDTFLRLASQKNIQLIVTTHESRLLDFDLLRRDEVWFIDKRKGGESDIYSLEEYNTRFDQKIDKAYLEGRYCGVPIFSTVFPVQEA